MKKLLSIVLCFALVFNIGIAAFAANETNSRDISFSATLSKAQLSASSTDQTVEMTVSLSQASTVSSFEFNVSCDSPISVVSVDTTSTMGSANEWNSNTKFCAWAGSADVTTATLAKITLLVPANTQAGSYSVGVSNIAVSDVSTGLNYWEDGASATATLTITDAVTDPYTAALSSTTTTVNNDGTSTVSVDVVVGGTTGSFASTEIKLAYDPAYLTYTTGFCALTPSLEEGQTDQAVSISAENGVVTIRDYGGNMTVDTNGTTAYTLVFDTVKGGNANVSLISAGFSTQDNAASHDLTYVTDTSSSVAVTINYKAIVTVDGTADATTYVTPNGNYTYQISDYNATKYTYTVTATENNVAVDANRISIGNTGLVTVTGVAGELSVTIEKTANTFNIQWTDTESAITSNKPATWNYGTDVTFTVKAGSQAANSTAAGYYYSVTAYLTDDSNKTALNYTSSSTDKYAEQIYTIDDTAITGDITIKVTKVEEKATDTTITIDGDFTELIINGETPSSKNVTVTKNEEVTVTVTEADGYVYKVETVVGETATELVKNAAGNYTFTPDEALTLKVTKTLDATSLAVSKYVQLDGKTMWLVKIDGLTDTTNKTYTYKDGEDTTAENFFWSSKYGVYCYLIITNTNTDADTVKANLDGKIGLTDTAAVTINYNGNVNLTTNNSTAVIDVNDAQLVWNMYSAVYSEFTDNVTVQKFLEADMDTTVGLSTNDAAEVVKLIG